VTLLERNEETAEQLARRADALQWTVAAFAGELPSASPADGDGEVAIDSSLSLVMRGAALDAADQRVFEAFAAQAVLALRQRRLSAAAEADKLRTALLRAVSHDLRTPPRVCEGGSGRFT
jgi:two-component system sensor histidine kinase KdpD